MHSAISKKISVDRWIKATFWGWLLGVALILILSSVLDAVGIEDMQFYVGVGMGLGVGFTQWLLLRKYTDISASWIWASVTGLGLPFLIIDVFLKNLGGHKLPFSVIAGGMLVSLFQYALLKCKSPKASLWIPACFAGWALAAGTVLTINFMMTIKSEGMMNLVLFFANLILILSGGIVLGLITGKALKIIYPTAFTTKATR